MIYKEYLTSLNNTLEMAQCGKSCFKSNKTCKKLYNLSYILALVISYTTNGVSHEIL